jgi:ATP-dependent Lon protease
MAETDKDDLISIIEDDDAEAEIPGILPLMPVRDVVVFTDMVLPLFVGREKSVRAVQEAVAKEGYLFLATQMDPAIENPDTDEIFTTGTVSRVLRMLKLPDGSVKILVQGFAKARIVNYTRRRSLYRVKVEMIQELAIEKISLKTEALMRNVREHCEKILVLRGEMSGDAITILQSIEEPGKLADLVASNLRLNIEDSQQLLEITDPMQRLKKVNDLLSREVQLSTMQAKIQSDVKEEMSRSQRDYFLREQVRAINRELGESEKDQARPDAEGSRQRSHQAVKTSGADASRIGRVNSCENLSGLAGGHALEQII